MRQQNRRHIVDTADHGFLFTETARVETDNSKLKEKPDSTILAKKRYLLGPNLPDRCGVAWQVERDCRGRGRHGVLDSQGSQPLSLCRWRTIRSRRGDASRDRGPRCHRQAHPGQISPDHKYEAGHGSGAWKQSSNHHRPAPVPINPNGICERPCEADHTSSGCVRWRGTCHGHPVCEVREEFRQPRRPEEVGQPRPQRAAIQKKTPFRLVLRDAETGIEQQSVEVIIDRAFTDDF